MIYKDLKFFDLVDPIPPGNRADIFILLLELTNLNEPKTDVDFHWNLMSEEMLEKIQLLLPAYVGLANNLKTRHLLCSVVVQDNRLRSEANQQRIETTILEKPEDWRRAILRYRGETTVVDGNSLCLCFVQYCKLAREVLSFAKEKITLSVSMCQTSKETENLISKTTDLGNKLSLGLISSTDAFEHGRKVQELMDNLKGFVSDYFNVSCPVSSEDILQTLQAVIDPDVSIEDIGLQGLLEAFHNGNLHQHFIFTHSSDFLDMAKNEQKLAIFLSNLKNWKPDEVTLAKRKLERKFTYGADLKSQVETALEDSSENLIRFKILLDDFSSLLKLYGELAASVIWDDSSYPFSQAVGSDLKQKLMIRIESEQQKKDEISDESRAIQKSLTHGRVLPKIDNKSWHRFLRLYRVEESNLKSDFLKCNAIRAALKSQQDIMGVENITNPQRMIDWLSLKYGHVTNVCSRSLDVLELSKPPSDGNYESFFVDVLNTFEFIKQENQVNLLNSEKVLKISNGIFSVRARELFAFQFLQLQTNLENEFVPTDEHTSFSQAWAGSFYGLQFINLIMDFIRSQLRLRKTLLVGNKPTISSFAVSNNSLFKCILCGGSHIDDNSARPRPWMSVCEKFLELSTHQRIAFIKKHSYCQVCLTDKSPKGKECRLYEKFNCKCSNSTRFPHHRLLCLSEQNARFADGSQNFGRRGSKRGKKKRGGNEKSSNNSNSSVSSLQAIGLTDCSSYKPKQNLMFNIFFKNLPLLLSAICTAASVNGQEKTKRKFQKHLQDDWVLQHFSMQAVFSSSVIHNGHSLPTLMLSDTGASISFVSNSFVRCQKLQPLGMWVGQIQTLNSIEEIRTPFFNINIAVENDVVSIICLETKNLGDFTPLPSPAYLKFAAFYGISPKLLLAHSGPIDFLIGCDNAHLLLKDVSTLDGRPVREPDWAPNVKICKSSASSQFSLIGAIGRPPWLHKQLGVRDVKGVLYFKSFDLANRMQSILEKNKYTFYVSKTEVRKPVKTLEIPELISSTTQALENSYELDDSEMENLISLGNQIRSKNLVSQKYPPSLPFAKIALAITTVLTIQRVESLNWTHKPFLNNLLFKLNSENFCRCSLKYNSFNLVASGATLCDSPNFGWTPDLNALNRYQLCEICIRRSSNCPTCLNKNSTLSLEKLRENDLLKNSIEILPHPDPLLSKDGKKIIQVEYPLKCNPTSAYRAELSNYEAARKSSVSLKNRLKMKGLLDQFTSEVDKSIQLGHLRFLSNEEKEEILQGFHCFIFINYVMKNSASTPLRVISNSSAPHKSGSINANTVPGETVLTNLYNICMNFFLKPYVVLYDLLKCYRSIYTGPTTNRLRLVSYWSNTSDSQSDDVLMINRVTFGDIAASSYLQIILQQVIASEVKTEFAKNTLLYNMYVDDGLASSHSMADIKEGMEDLKLAFAKFDFKIKHVILNFEKLPESVSPIQSIFHMNWSIDDDLIFPNITFNIYEKNRGIKKGPDLIEMKTLDKIILTKQIAARLLGQIFDLSGSVTVLRSAFLINFSRICVIAKTWTEILPPSSEVYRLFFSLLEDVRSSIQLLQPFIRLKIPKGFKVKEIAVHSDASVDVVAFTIHIKSKDKAEKFKSHLLTAGSWIRHGSVPSLELLSFAIALDKTNSILVNHNQTLINQDEETTLFFLLDSECSLYALCPHKVSRSILQRNVKNEMTNILTQLTTKFETLVIKIAHVASELQVADLATKVPASIVDTLNSNAWRFGAKEGLFKAPPQKDVFLTVKQGSFKWHKENSNPNECVQCCNTICGNSLDTFKSNMSFYCSCYFCCNFPSIGLIESIFATSASGSPALPQLNVEAVYFNFNFHLLADSMRTPRRGYTPSPARIQDAFPGIKPHKSPVTLLNRWSKSHPTDVIDILFKRVASVVTCDSRELWTEVIKDLPLLGNVEYWSMIYWRRKRDPTKEVKDEFKKLVTDFYKRVTKFNRNITDCLKAVCRILLVTLPPKHRKLWDPRTIFDLGMDFPKSVWKQDSRMISFPAKLVKLAFFTIVKTSQYRFPPDLRNVEHIVQSGMCFAKTRYTVPTMLNGFGSPFLPIVSSQDVQLCNLLVKNAHVVVCNGKLLHLPAEITMSRILGSAVGASYIVDAKNLVSNYIRNCVHCNVVKASKGKFRNYLHHLGDPMFISNLENGVKDAGFFRRISLDALEVPVRVRSGQRGGPTHKIGLLFGLCLQTNFFFVRIMENLQTSAIRAALQVIFMEYSRPDKIILDNFSSFRSLKDHNPWPDIEISVRPTAHQFSNQVESSIKIFKTMLQNICSANLTQLELSTEMSLVAATMNLRPTKRINRNSQILTLSPKALLFPILSFQEIREWELHVADQLNTDISWDGFEKLKNRNQEALQHTLLEYLWMESTWKYSTKKGGSSKTAGEHIYPEDNDLVACKLSDGSFRIGIITNAINGSICAVRVIIRGVEQILELHSSTLGLLSRLPAPEKVNANLVDFHKQFCPPALPKLTPQETKVLSCQLEDFIAEGIHQGYSVKDHSRVQHITMDGKYVNLQFPHKLLLWKRASLKTEDSTNFESSKCKYLDDDAYLNVAGRQSLPRLNECPTGYVWDNRKEIPPYMRNFDYSNLMWLVRPHEAVKSYEDWRFLPLDYFVHFSPCDHRQGVPFVRIKPKMFPMPALKMDATAISKLEPEDDIVCTYIGPKTDAQEDEVEIIYDSSNPDPDLLNSGLKRKVLKAEDCKNAIKQAFALTFPEASGSSKRMIAADFFEETDPTLEVYEKQPPVKISLRKRLEPNVYDGVSDQETCTTPCASPSSTATLPLKREPEEYYELEPGTSLLKEEISEPSQEGSPTTDKSGTKLARIYCRDFSELAQLDQQRSQVGLLPCGIIQCEPKIVKKSKSGNLKSI